MKTNDFVRLKMIVSGELSQETLFHLPLDQKVDA
jgi:hypothetical protein